MFRARRQIVGLYQVGNLISITAFSKYDLGFREGQVIFSLVILVCKKILIVR